MAVKRKLGRATDVRKSMLRGMVTDLLHNSRIVTTLQRARDLSAQAEKMITLGKNNNLANKRRALRYITKEDIVKRLFDEISPKYKDVNGGYVSVLKLGQRRGDGAQMAIVALK